MEFAAWADIDLGNFTIIDLIAATTNAFNGAFLARQPSHYRKFTILGILLIAIVGGIGGGVTRDVLLNDIPSALTNPLYIILCVASPASSPCGRPSDSTRRDRPGCSTSCRRSRCPGTPSSARTRRSRPTCPTSPASSSASSARPPVGSSSTSLRRHATALRPWRVVRRDGHPDQHRVPHRGRGFGLTIWPATLIAFAVGFTFRIAARRLKWEEPLPKDPTGVPVMSS